MFIFLQLFLIQPRVILQGRAQLRVSVQQVQHQLQRVPAQETHFIIILYLLSLTRILFYKISGVYNILHGILCKREGENNEINSPENICPPLILREKKLILCRIYTPARYLVGMAIRQILVRIRILTRIRQKISADFLADSEFGF